MKEINLELISRVVIILIIAGVAGYALHGMSSYSDKTEAEQTEKIEALIDKALIQCYALEGSYPPASLFDEKMTKYGVIIDNDKYIYHYEIFGSNIKPFIRVIPKS